MVLQGLRRFVELKRLELVVKEVVILKEARCDGKWVLRINTNLFAGGVASDFTSLSRTSRTTVPPCYTTITPVRFQ